MVDDLLDLAARLVRLDEFRPRQASLKRAISTAYYAVFHALAEVCSHELATWRAGWAGRAAITRSLEHSSARRLKDLTAKHELFDPDFVEIGTAFFELQAARHRSDYDPRPLDFGREGAKLIVDRAGATVSLIRRLSPQAKLKLAIFLIARSQR